MLQQKRHAKSSTSSNHPTPNTSSQFSQRLPQPEITVQSPDARNSSRKLKCDEVFIWPFTMVNTSFAEVRRMNEHLPNLVDVESSSTDNVNETPGSRENGNGNRSFKNFGHRLKLDMVFVALNPDEVPEALNLPDVIKKGQKSLYIYDCYLTDIFTDLVGELSKSSEDLTLAERLSKVFTTNLNSSSPNPQINEFMKKLFNAFQSSDAARRKREVFRTAASRKLMGLFRKETSTSSSKSSSQEKRIDESFKTTQKSKETHSMSKISTATDEDDADQQPTCSGYSYDWKSASTSRHQSDDFEGNIRDVAEETPIRLEYNAIIDFEHEIRLKVFKELLIDYRCLLKCQESLRNRSTTVPTGGHRAKNPAVRPTSLDTQDYVERKRPEHLFKQEPIGTKKSDENSDDEAITSPSDIQAEAGRKDDFGNRDMSRFCSELHSGGDNTNYESGKAREKFFGEEEGISHEGAASKPSITAIDATESILLHHVNKLRSSFIRKNKTDESEPFTKSHVRSDRHGLKPFETREDDYTNYHHLEDEITIDWLTDCLWHKLGVLLVLTDDKILLEDHVNDLHGQFETHEHNRRENTNHVDYCFHSINKVYIAYDRNNNCFLVPTTAVIEPERTEEWLSIEQLSLSEVREIFPKNESNGVFLISLGERADALTIHNLSVLYNGEIRHYRIVNVSNGGGYTIEGGKQYFTSLNELVGFYRRNRANLCTRLRKPLSHCGLPSINSSYHYDKRYDIESDHLQRLVPTWNFDFGLVSTGGFYPREDVEPVDVYVMRLMKKKPDTVSEEDVADFFDVADIMINLKHENIIEFVGIVNYPHYYIVTEYVKENLKTHLERVNPNYHNASDYHRICLQIASVLKYLEFQRFVIHRRICCNSFLFIESTTTVKLFNFSRARKVHSDQFVGEEKDDVDVIGAAPETLKLNVYSTKTDVWSAGFTFWEVFSKGGTPFEATPLEVYMALCYTGVFIETPDSCPNEVFNVIKSCLRSKPEHRLTSTELYKTFKDTEQACQNFQRRKPRTVPPEDDSKKRGSRPPMTRGERVVSSTPGDNEAKLTTTILSGKSTTPKKPSGPTPTQNVPQQSYYGGVSVKPPRPTPSTSDQKKKMFQKEKR